MGSCACNDRESSKDSTIEIYRAKMLIEYVKGLKHDEGKRKIAMKKQAVEDLSSKSSESEIEKDIADDSYKYSDEEVADEDSYGSFEIPEEVRVGDIFVADDGSRFKLNNIDGVTQRKILTCLSCLVRIDDIGYKNHLNSEQHKYNLE
ncbi:unnamed protein product [Blepharisma stoltei]|uniref:Uncharacterized protein n=1 Tax=Blepharisma stoltei TaxID=1481888 RepID=A0AAU9IYZ4_9CILI|nr:unnamed protein product [Blepharisma stoltei]